MSERCAGVSAATPGTCDHLGMRVHRSFAFVDLSGFTALTELEGDERAVAVVSDFRSMLREICSRRAVRIAKWLGDGAMLVCVDSEPLLAAVLEMHHVVGADPTEPIAIRSGATSGDVILLEGDDYIGHPVNVAARLCDLASGGQLLAAPSVLGALPKWAAVGATEEVTLRGVERTMRAALLGMRPSPGRPCPTPSAGSR